MRSCFIEPEGGCVVVDDFAVQLALRFMRGIFSHLTGIEFWNL